MGVHADGLPWINDDTITVQGSAASWYLGQELSVVLNVDETIEASVTRIELDVPLGTESSFCWINLCYPILATGAAPAYTSLPFEFLDDWYLWDIDQFRIYYYPAGVADTAYYRYTLFKTDDPSLNTSFVARFIAHPSAAAQLEVEPEDVTFILSNLITDDHLHLSWPSTWSSNRIRLKVMSMAGAVLMSVQLSGSQWEKVPLPELSPGMYIVSAELEEHAVHIQRVMVE